MAGHNNTPAERGTRHLWLDAVLTVPTTNTAGIDAYAVAVACALYSYMNANGLAWPGLRALADRAKVKHDTVDDRLKRLEAAGLLRVQRQYRRANRYQAVIPGGADPVVTTSSRRHESIPPNTTTVPWGGTDESVPWHPESVPPQRPSVPYEGPNCPTPAPNCPVGWDPTGEPAKPGEPVNPARSGGAPNGAPALGGSAPVSASEIVALHERTDAASWVLDEHDNNSGVWGTDEHEFDPPDKALTGAVFTERLRASGYYRINEDNEYVARDDLTANEVRAINATCEAVEAWKAGEEPIFWIRRTLERQQRFLNPAGGIERMPHPEVSRL